MSAMHTLPGDFLRQRLQYHRFSGVNLDRRANFGLSAQFGACFFSSGTPVRPLRLCGIDAHLKNGNKPLLKSTLVPELWRAEINRGESWSGTGLTKGKKLLLQNLRNHLGYDSVRMGSLDILSTDIPLAERMMYIALDTWFLRNHIAAQLQQARDHVERHIETLRNGL
jgi:hypothetical protein